MSSIAFECQNCQHALEFSTEAAGSTVRCPSCRESVVVPSSNRVTSSESSKTPKRKKKKKIRDENSLDPKRPQHLQPWLIPVLMLGAGLLISVVISAFYSKAGPMRAIAYNFLETCITVPITLGAMYISVLLLGVTYGEISIAALKVAAMVVVNNSVILICLTLGVPVFLIWGINMLVTFMMFQLLFELELQDAVVAIIIVVVARWLIARMIFTALWG